jgi:hypothetical protein
MTQPLSLSQGLLLGLILLGSSVAFAQAPAQAPAPTAPPLFMREGKISTVDLTEGTLTVNDLRYNLSPTVRVYTYNRSIKDPQALRADSRLKDGRVLRAGMRIGYTVAGEGGGKRGELTEVWLLPAGSLPELDRGVRSAEQPATKATGKAQRAQPSK